MTFVQSKTVVENTDKGPDEYETDLDLEDVHKLLMDENSDSDSDEDKNNPKSAVTDKDVQNLLFQDQDFSDSNGEEKENQDAVPPQNEPSVIKKVSAFISSIQKKEIEAKENEKILPQHSETSSIERESENLSSLQRQKNQEIFISKTRASLVTNGEKPIIFAFEENGEQYMIGSEVTSTY